MLYLIELQKFVYAEHLGRGYARLVQLCDDLFYRELLRPLFNVDIHLGSMRVAHGHGLEAWVIRKLRAPDDIGELEPVYLRRGNDIYILAVFIPEAADRRGTLIEITDPAAALVEQYILRYRIDQETCSGVHQRQLHALPLARFFALDERGKHGIGAVYRCAVINDECTHEIRFSIGRTGEAHQPTRCLKYAVKARLARHRAALTEAGDRRKDELWVELVKFVPTQTHLLKRTRTVVFHEHVRIRQQRAQ